MIGKSAAMMRRSSPITRSRSPATGRCTSRSETGASCWLTLLGPGERLRALPDVHEPDVHGEHPPVELARLDALPLLLQCAPQPVEDAESLLVARGGELERAPQDRLRHHVRALLEEAGAQRLCHSQLPVRRPHRLLKLGDSLC